jgi:AraC-like DNA-binding protein
VQAGLQPFMSGVMFAAYAICLAAAWSRPINRDVRWTFTLFAGGGVIGGLGSVLIPTAFPDLSWDTRFVHFAVAAHWAWFLLLAQVMFDEQKLRPVHFAPAAVMYVMSFVMLMGSFAGSTSIVRTMNQLTSAGDVVLMAWALVVIARSWRGDLVARRRRMRWAVFTVGSIYSLLYGLAWFPVEYGWIDGEPIVALNRWMNIILMIGAANAVLDVSPDLDRPVATVSEAKAGFSEASRLALMRLHAVMGKGEAWRRPGLTMDQLATETGVSERQLRRLINERLGHTNFAGFLNSYRIEAARSQLADPSVTGTLAEIAAELGYASVATFNRAFKEATGQTPGAWRKAIAPPLAEAAAPVKATLTG